MRLTLWAMLDRSLGAELRRELGLQDTDHCREDAA